MVLPVRAPQVVGHPRGLGWFVPVPPSPRTAMPHKQWHAVRCSKNGSWLCSLLIDLNPKEHALGAAFMLISPVRFHVQVSTYDSLSAGPSSPRLAQSTPLRCHHLLTLLLNFRQQAQRLFTL